MFNDALLAIIHHFFAFSLLAFLASGVRAFAQTPPETSHLRDAATPVPCPKAMIP